ncbi:hypothetical protein J437_LFUL000583 [Ladona fulva]|uniref:[acyl-carrier-protein] S-malonyltransferase n=1 Tax=Ladona fulva TaxID=123851 RepID=A0A8K0P2R8_LADFU|nr:hypothetical protein J437_LFUL000583 [Ladona fulva]
MKISGVMLSSASNILSMNCFRRALIKLTFSRYLKIQSIRLWASSTRKDESSPTSEENVEKSKASVEELLSDSVVGKEQKPTTPEEIWATTVYPKSERRIQARNRLAPRVDPRETSIILFPGQGAQAVGMGKDLLKFPVVKDLFEAASEILGYDLLKLCLNGPKEKLDKTIYCQPAIFVCSIAALERLVEERPASVENCVATAGFSVGEIAALVFAGSLTFENGKFISYDLDLNLVKVRAEAMQYASEITPCGMATVLYGPDSQLGYACLKAKEWCKEQGIENPVCKIANYLYPHCKVVAGNLKALEFLEKNASTYKLKRIRRLPVSGAFHTDLMRPAAEPFKAALKKADVKDPVISVHSNVDGKRYSNANHVIRQLPKQIYRSVKWEQTLHVLYERPEGEYFPKTFECGPGSSLKTILKMFNVMYCSITWMMEY